MWIILDTNVLCEDYLLDGPNARMFFGELRKAGHSLVMLQLIIDEARNKHREKLVDLRRQVDLALAPATALTGEKPPVQISDDYITIASESRNQRVTARLKQVSAKVRGYPQVSHKRIVSRLLARRRPFTKDDMGYRDTLIWESVLALAKSEAGLIAFITKDKAFYEDEQQIHPDLLIDLDECGIERDRVKVIKDLKTFLDLYVKPTLAELTTVRRQLQVGSYRGVRIADIAQQQGRKYLRDIVHADLRDWLKPPIFFSVPAVKEADAVSDVEVTDVRRLSSGELHVTMVLPMRFTLGEFGLISPEVEYTDLLTIVATINPNTGQVTSSHWSQCNPIPGKIISEASIPDQTASAFSLEPA